MLQSLKELHAQGEDLRYRPMREKHQPLFWAAHCLFGSYANAVRAMGFDYWTMSQAQLARQRKRAPAFPPANPPSKSVTKTM